MNSGIKKLLKPLASLYLTVALLLLSMLLIYGGTAVQKELSIQDVQKQFFHSWFVHVPLDPFFRPFAAAGSTSWLSNHGFWTVGGYSLIVLLLANLFAAHSVRFKLNWKRSGIIAIHLGLIVMLFGEVFASLFSVENQMMIDVGQTSHYTYDTKRTELAVIDPSPTDHNNVTVFDQSLLNPGSELHAASVPFTITVDNYFANSRLAGPMQDAAGAVAKATAGINERLRVLPTPKAVGTDSMEDMASAFVTVHAEGENPQTYLLTQWANPGFDRPEVSPYFGMVTGGPQTIQVGGKKFQIDLRFKRTYKPYQITLLKFSHELHPGTDVPSNFASYIRLVDPRHNVDREVKIWMNHPLTYPSLEGETFYQQAFQPGDKTSILQVTHNPAWPMPYIGLALGLVGMLVHFGMHLISFLRRQSASRKMPPKLVTRPTNGRRPTNGSRFADASLIQYTLQARSNLGGWIAAAIGAGLCVAMIISVNTKAPVEGFDLAAFSKLPVVFGGRPMPLDTLAQITLKIISGKESFTDLANKNVTHPAIRWLADTICDAPNAMKYKVIRIDYPDIISQMGLDSNEKYFSLQELLAHKDIVQKQFDLAINIDEKQRDLYQKHIVDLAQHVEQYLELQQAGRLLLVPPTHDNGENWQPLTNKAGQLTPGSESIVRIIQDYHDDKPREFNEAVLAYHDTLTKTLPHTMAKVDYEVIFNHADPFLWCMWMYVGVFALACCSWLGLRKVLWSAAMGALVVIVGYHTFGIASRVYLTGWGPVTNLYSSAVFIGWAVVLLSIGLELIYRNGIGAAVAAIIGFGTLVIAYFLGLDGDTMKPIVAVLMTKFWLWTHVPCVTLGYASTLLSGVLAISYVVLGLFTKKIDEPTGKTMARMVYGISCFAILFSFVGTILGGIWADYSWGRFWGWDPKENGAILIVLWNAIILHARWGGIVKQRGMMVLAILGIIVTSWSWFGTNLLGVGLHSYGFVDGWAQTLVTCWCVTLVLVGLGLLPQRVWRSYAKPKVNEQLETLAAR